VDIANPNADLMVCDQAPPQTTVGMPAMIEDRKIRFKNLMRIANATIDTRNSNLAGFTPRPDD
jgi:hypothetical protein